MRLRLAIINDRCKCSVIWSHSPSMAGGGTLSRLATLALRHLYKVRACWLASLFQPDQSNPRHFFTKMMSARHTPVSGSKPKADSSYISSVDIIYLSDIVSPPAQAPTRSHCASNAFHVPYFLKSFSRWQPSLHCGPIATDGTAWP